MTAVFSTFFGLQDNPFRANPDPRYLFLTQQTQDSLDQLIQGISARKGLMLLTGEVGTGKTVLLNRLMEWLDQERIPKAFIFNSHLKVNELFDLILQDFGISSVAQRGAPFAAFTNWLEDRYRAGETAVLIVDEAQGLALNVIEELCMLLNQQTPHGSLLQIILCGQPEFDAMLQRPGLRQMRQRVAARCRTLPLTLEETRSYITNRLRVAGASDPQAAIFHPEAVQALYLYSGGIARVLNLLCEQALMRASREKLRPVPGRIIGEVAHEFQFDGVRPLAPLFAAESANVLELFAPRPVVGETLGRFAAAALLRDDARLEANSPDISSGARANQPAAPAAPSESMAQSGFHPAGRSPAGDVASETPHPSKPPIKFPAQVRPQPPAARGLKEIAASSSLGSPTPAPTPAPTNAPTDALIADIVAASRMVTRATMPASPVPQRQFDLRKRWERDFLSMAKRAKRGIAALSSRARTLKVLLETWMLLSFRVVGRRLALWRRKYRHARIAFQWPHLAKSWRQWLQATSRRTVHRMSTAVPRRSVPQPNIPQASVTQPTSPQPAPAAQTLAASQISRRRPASSATRVLRRRNPENTRRLTTSVLHWLQQPSRTLSNWQSTHSSSSKRIA
ncbi:MAG: AAA family ATPase [Candidatus Acidiferrales bacterium]